ncbi:MAG: HAMP domain-containing histidine kinase [Methanimicrococcus sp.]|nr:HAMP domain-containing histidine kinase [Methanimicrococcus sp.]MCL2142051.1 HAMP domain-containing histidine kinase [Methanimicrococcus sp.]
MVVHSSKEKDSHFHTSEEVTLQASPKPHCILSAEEISQNRAAFLHDILNTAGGLAGFLEMIVEYDDPVKMKKYAVNSLELCQSLIEEIQYNRQLLLAENNILNLMISETPTKDILQLTILKLKRHSVSRGRTIEIEEDAGITIRTDKVLISRILVNMVKNAVEATIEGGNVQIGSNLIEDKIRFWVHNDSFIPEEIQERMFQKSFSTKAQNRGVGILSILLLADNLNAEVQFESTKEKGTLFFIDLPLNEVK